MKILCLKHAFSYIVYMTQKQSQNHLLLAITSRFSSCCCYFNLTTKTSHNHVSSRITRVHFWKKKKHPEKTQTTTNPPPPPNKQTPQQTKTKLPLPSQFLNCVHTLQNLVQGIRPSWDPPLVGPEQNKLTSVIFRKLLSKAERKVLIALNSECLFTPLSCWTKKEKKWKATQLVQGELAKLLSGEVHCIRMTKYIQTDLA